MKDALTIDALRLARLTLCNIFLVSQAATPTKQTNDWYD
jgi:hypothetical protein